ncbi:MAG: alpha/beta fold hydrolase [Gammaproteobacteria bacterium]
MPAAATGNDRRRYFRGTCYALHRDARASPAAPLVLLHGVGLSQAMWSGPAALLSNERQVLTYDLLGHGGSADPPGARVIGDFVTQLRELTQHLGLRSFALAGFSMGALVALAFASKHSERLTGLALLHAVYKRSAAQCAGARARARIARERGPEALLEAAFERWFSPEYRAAHPEVIEEIRAMFAAHGDGYLKAYRLFAHAEAEMARYPPKQAACPALVITGGKDVGSTPAMARALSGDLPNAQLIINDEHRHLAPLEHAQRILSQVREFLQKAERGARR